MNRHRVLTYLTVTYAITGTFWWSLALLTNLRIVDASQGIFTLLHVIGGFGPTIAALFVLPDRKPKAIMRFVFSGKQNGIWYLLLFCAMQTLVIGISSRETNPVLPWYALPIVLFSATFFGGGNEELGWRGILQPELEKRFSFPVATLMAGCLWMAWHIPLWFVIGASQQGMHFGLYCVYGLVLSFWLAVLHKKTENVFLCAVFHGVSNLLLSFFVIKINAALVVGLIATLLVSIWLYYRTPTYKEQKNKH